MAHHYTPLCTHYLRRLVASQSLSLSVGTNARMPATFGGVRAVLAALLLHKQLRACPRLGSELLSENRRLKLESLASVQMPNNRATTVLLNCKRDYFAWTLGMDGSELIILTGSTLGKS